MTLVKSARPDAGSKVIKLPLAPLEAARHSWLEHIDRELARRSRVHGADRNPPEARGNIVAPIIRP